MLFLLNSFVNFVSPSIPYAMRIRFFSFLLGLSIGLLSPQVGIAQIFDWAIAMEFGYETEIAIDDRGNIIIVGQFEDTVDFDPGPGIHEVVSSDKDVFVLKLDASSNFVWVKNLGPPKDSNNPFGHYINQTVTTDKDNNILITGVFTQPMDVDPGPDSVLISPSLGNIYLLKLDATGSYEWVVVFNTNGFGHSVVTDPMGDVIFTDYFEGIVDFDPGSGVFQMESSRHAVRGDPCFVKLNSNGYFEWAKSLKVTKPYGAWTVEPGEIPPHKNHIATDSAGNIIISGGFRDTIDFDPGPNSFLLQTPSLLTFNTFILKLDVAGRFVWAKSFKGGNNYEGDLAVDAQGNIIIGGGGNVGLVDFDPGNDIYERNTSSGFFTKLNNAGEFQWVITLADQDSSWQSLWDIETSPEGSLYITGSFYGSIDFDPGPGEFILQSDADIPFVQKFNSNGHFLWTGAFWGKEYGVGKRIKASPDGGVVTVGRFIDSLDFDMGPGTYVLESSDGNTFIQKTNLTDVSIDDDLSTTSFQLYPNPTGNKVFLKFPLEIQHENMRIIDLYGREYYNGIIQKHLDVSDYAPGLYHITIGHHTKRMLKI